MIRMRSRCKGEAIEMGLAAGSRGRLSSVSRRMRGVGLGKRVGGEIWRGRGRGWEKGGRWGSGEGFERDFRLGCTLLVMIPPPLVWMLAWTVWRYLCKDFSCREMEIGIARDRNHRTGSGILSICGDGVMYSIEVCIVLDGRILTKRLLSVTPATGDLHATMTSAAAIIGQEFLWQSFATRSREGRLYY